MVSVEDGRAINLFSVENLSLTYGSAGARRKVLDNVEFSIDQGEMVAIQGPSGSGKSTLFYILGCMLRPQAGQILFKGTNVLKLDDLELSLFRNQNIGFIFQQFHLLQRANVLSNILLPSVYPVELTHLSSKAAVKRARELAERLGLTECLEQMPNQLSGGQQQRVAIARALMNDVDVILADEPTGNLDTVNAKAVLEILSELHREGKTIILITHDNEVAAHCPRKLLVKDGKITEGNQSSKQTGMKAPTSKKLPLLKPNPINALLRILPLAMQNITRNRLRSLLTMLGVMIGVGAVVAMLTLGNYTRERILEGYESLGVNRLVISGYRNWNRNPSKITTVNFNSFDMAKDLEPLREIFPEISLLSPVVQSNSSNITYGGKSYSEGVMTFGVGHEYAKISNSKIAKGSFFSVYHVEMRSSVCIIGEEIEKQLGQKRSLLGELISVGGSNSMGFPCRVIGILAPQKSAIEWFQPDKQVLLPYTYIQANSDIWASRIRAVNLTVRSGSDVEEVGKKIKGFFDLKYEDSGEFSVDSNTTLVAQMKRFLDIFAMLIAGIAFLALLVGGIGIQNMMLVSIADRLKEIGLRKAIGATNRSLKQQILLEAMLLCSIAGLIGLIVGISSCLGLLYFATKVLPDLKFEIVIDPTAVIVSCLAIIAVGVLSGLAPAIKAERLQVIEALRAE